MRNERVIAMTVVLLRRLVSWLLGSVVNFSGMRSEYSELVKCGMNFE